MDKIKIKIDGRVAEIESAPEVVTDNAEYEVEFAVDERDGWNPAVPMTALFVRRDARYTAVVMDVGETICTMPPQTGTNIVYVGLTQDDMRTTTPAAIKVQRSIRTVANDPLPAPTEDVYAQILAAYAGIKILSGKGAPTSATQGKVNQLYRDEDTQKLYICTATDGGGYTWAAVVSDTEDAITYTAQTLTEGQKTQARANIGAGTSNFSGSYNDLNDQPNIPAATVIDTTLTKSGQAADAKAAGDAIGKKLDKAQGAENAGRVLAVVNNGNVFPVEPGYLPGLVSYTVAQGLTHEQQEIAKQNIGAGTLRKVYYWDVAYDTPENPNSVMRYAEYGDTCICLNQTMLPHGMVGPVLVIYGEISYGRRSATAFDGSNATWTFSVNLSDYSYSTPIKKSGVPAPTTAQVGQIVKVKSVDESGKIAETETVDIPSGGTYTLPIASQTVLGGVKPIAKTDAMTQGVGVDDVGALWTVTGGEDWELIAHIDVTADVANNVTEWLYSNLPRYKYIAYRKINLKGSSETQSGLGIQINGENTQPAGLSYAKSTSVANGHGLIYVMPFGWGHVTTHDSNSPNNHAMGGITVMYNTFELTDNAITSIKLRSHNTYKIASGDIWLYGKK